ncbi:MAG TPA: hypothetical protein DCM07_18530, partial [Planctomycetaceae bacterium]|nr:hypothetical protein [Planctomycetaceae bacterium]
MKLRNESHPMENPREPIPTSVNSATTVTELFHRVNSVIPDSQKLVTVEPEMLITDALDLLEQHGYSQVPVVVGQEVLGLF